MPTLVISMKQFVYDALARSSGSFSDDAKLNKALRRKKATDLIEAQLRATGFIKDMPTIKKEPTAAPAPVSTTDEVKP